MAIKVAVIERDSRFLDRLTNVFSKSYSDKLELYPFTDPDVALSTLAFIKPHILIAEESVPIAPSSLPLGCALAYFVSAVGTDRVGGYRAICKFQRAELIYKQILGIVSDSGDSAAQAGRQASDSKFLVFTSPAGGVGVSTSAAAFALKAASQGKRVLYLDLDEYGCPGLYFHGEGSYSFGDVLHMLVHKDGNLTDLLSHATRKDPRGVSFFREAPDTTVYPTVSAEDISRLLRELRVLAAFDYIAVDIPFAKLLTQRELWDRAAGIVLLTDDSELGQRKLTRGYFTLLREAESRSGGMGCELFLLNSKCTGFPMRSPELSDLRELGQIPFLEGMEAGALLTAVSGLPVFDALL